MDRPRVQRDKGSNANVGFWVHNKDEWDWLRSLLSVDTIKQLLADEYKRLIASSCRICTPCTSCYMITWTAA